MATKELAQGLAGLGRNGDSMLMHVQPHEVAGLQALAKSQGTSLTINPNTGLPEAFSLGGFFKSLLPTIAGFAAAGMSGGAMSPMLAGILAGAGTGALTNKDPLTGALMGGLGGYGGANLFSAAKGFTPAASGATTAKSAATDQTISNLASNVGTTADQALLDPLVSQQISMYTPAGGTAQTAALGGAEATYGALTAPSATTAATAGSYAPNFNAIPGAVQGTGGYQAPSVFASDASALKSAAGNIAADPFGFAMQNKMGVGMPLAMAGLSGLEPSDIYGKPMKPSDAGKYDPYSKLNLDYDTGLRLYAAGGSITTGGIRDLYGSPDDQTNGAVLSREGYGLGRLQAMADGGIAGYARGGYLDGPGDGMSDSIPATIEGKQPARLADGEFVVPADVVSHLGNGSTKAGSQRLYGMLDKVRKARTGTKKQGRKINADKFLPA